MKRLSTFALALVLIGTTPKEARALGSDHSKDELAKRGANCVHGFWVNETDVFFYTGDAAKFNEFVADQAKQAGARLRIVYHKGAKKARSPWDKADRDIAVDWSITTGPTAGPKVNDQMPTARIDLWLGGKVKKEDVKLPAGVELVPEAEGEAPPAEKK